jgi:threonine dehydrogenase-like Zn-dependent dehydrogenase
VSDLALEFGATDIISERGEKGVACIKELTGSIGADSVLESVGTQESIMQAINCTRPGGSIGHVGVPHGVQLDGQGLFFAQTSLLVWSRPGAPVPAAPDGLSAEAQDRAGQGLRPDAAAC